MKRSINSFSLSALLLFIFLSPESARADFDLAKLTESGKFIQILLVYSFGVITSFTPCVYPLIPVTLAIFGAKKDEKHSRAVMLAVVYVLGLCVTYTALGLFSALTGAVFGTLLGNPIVVLLVAAFLFLLLLYNFDLVPLPVVNLLQSRANRIGGSGFLGAFSMGLVGGVIAAPCTGPALVAILTVAGKGGDPLWGSVLLFFYALGIGTLFLALASFSSLGSRLPRSGPWLLGAKFIIGSAIVYVIGLLIRPLIPGLGFSAPFWIGGILGAAALASGAVGVRKCNKWVQFSSALALGSALIILTLPRSTSSPLPENVMTSISNHEQLSWGTSLETALSSSTHPVVMVDLFAEWCAACKEFDLITFQNPEVRKVLSKFSLVRLDFTDPGDPEDVIADRYNIQGLPTILFLDKEGTEIEGSRVTGFLSPDKFLSHITKIGS